MKRSRKTSREPDTTARRFAIAYIEANLNATEAARKVFRPGAKGGKNPDHSAEQMGHRMVRKLEVQQHIEKFLETSEASVYEALKALAEIMQSPDPEVSRKAAVDILRYHGKYDRQPNSSQNHHQHVHLVIPARTPES